MALPTTGQLTASQIQAEFNQTGQWNASDYYRGGGIVPSTSGVAGGVAEVQSVGLTGATSNTVSGSAGSNEQFILDLDSRFNSGITQIRQVVAFNNLGSATVSIGDLETWPIGTTTPQINGVDTTDWTYTATDGSFADIEYVGTTLASIFDISYEFEINFTRLPSSGSAAFRLLVSAQNGVQRDFTVTTTGTQTFTLTPVFSRAAGVLNNDAEMGVSISTFLGDQDFDFTVTAFRVVLAATSTATLTFDPDLTDTHITTAALSNVALSTNLSVDAALLEIRDLIIGQFTGMTQVGALTDSTVNGNAARRLVIDSGQAQDLMSMFNLETNTARDLAFVFAEVDGSSGQFLSSFTLSDYNGSDKLTITGTSGQSLADIGSALATQITDTMESPIEFNGSFASDTLTTTAQAVGSLNPGMVSTARWTMTIDHFGGDGDIGFATGVTTTTNGTAITGTFNQATRGRDTLSQINADVPTTGQVNFSHFHGATFGDN